MTDTIFEYEKNNTGVTLKKFLSGGEEVVIPSHVPDGGELAGLPVTAIGPECFKENGLMIRSIRVPETVRFLEHDAFAYLVSLEELILPEGIEFLGADYLIASGLLEAYIPAGVERIERPELIDRNFKVSPENKYFTTDGFGLYETRENVKTLIAVNASDERDSYTIADGTNNIAPSALCDIATLKELIIPAQTKLIHEGSLSFTGGRASGSTGIERISVSPENKNFFVKYNCLCRGSEGEELTLLRYFGGKECILSGNIKRIGNQCFKNTPLENIRFEKEIYDIGDEAFSGCPLSYAYISDTLIFFGEEDRFTTEKFVSEFGKNGKLYDFGVYDAFLVNEYLTEPRIRMIAKRLRNPKDLNQNTESSLKSKINENMTEVIKLLALEHNSVSLNELGELGFFTADNIDKCIELAGQLEEKEMTAWFMSYKNKNIGFTDGLEFL